MNPTIRVCLTRICILYLTMVLTQACSFSSDHKENRDVGRYMKLEIGESNRIDVYNQFKQPIDVYSTPKGRAWMYLSADSETHFSTFIPFVGLFTGGGINTTYTTYFFFDKDGVLFDVISSTEEDYVNMWEGMAGLTSDLVTGRWGDAESAVENEMASLSFPYKDRGQWDLPPRITSNRSIVMPSATNSETTQGATTVDPSPEFRTEVEQVAESMLCDGPMEMKAKTRESESWALDCGDGEVLEVRCFEGECYITST